MVSFADLGLNGNAEPVMPYGNVHGGIVELGGGWQEVTIPLAECAGVHSLYFTFEADKLQFQSFESIK